MVKAIGGRRPIIGLADIERGLPEILDRVQHDGRHYDNDRDHGDGLDEPHPRSRIRDTAGQCGVMMALGQFRE